MKSKAAITDGKGNFTIDTIDIGSPGAKEVKVDLHAASLCHTDWDSLSWGRKMVLGHEGAGVVAEVGDGVHRVKKGDPVVLNWAIPCGHCLPCREGRRHICANHSPVTGTEAGHAHALACTHHNQALARSFHLGTLSTSTIVREEALVTIPKSLPFTSVCLLGCGVMTGFGSVIHAGKVKAGDCVAILGCGGVGLNAIQAARIAGAKFIIAIDIKKERREQALLFGATHAIPGGSYEQMRKAIETIHSGQGADLAIECTALPELGDAPLALVRNGGRAVQASGIEQNISFDCRLFEWDKTYINPLYGQCDPDRDFPNLIALYQSGQLKLDEQVSRIWELDELQQAFDALLSGQGAKNVIRLRP